VVRPGVQVTGGADGAAARSALEAPSTISVIDPFTELSQHSMRVATELVLPVAPSAVSGAVPLGIRPRGSEALLRCYVLNTPPEQANAAPLLALWTTPSSSTSLPPTPAAPCLTRSWCSYPALSDAAI